MDFKVITAVTTEPVPNFSGIYTIRCAETGKVYVGSAVWIAKRWRHHREELRRGEHANSLLQRAWNKYGEDVFEFAVLERCEKEELLAAEQRHIDALRAADRSFGFNLCAVAGSPLGRKLTEEQRARISEQKRGTKLSEDHKRAVSESLKGNKRALGFKHSPQTLAKLGEISRANYAKNKVNLVYRMTEEQRAAVSDRFRGKPLSEEHRAKISAAHKGRVRSAASEAVRGGRDGV